MKIHLGFVPLLTRKLIFVKITYSPIRRAYYAKNASRDVRLDCQRTLHIFGIQGKATYHTHVFSSLSLKSLELKMSAASLDKFCQNK